ncbi:hypothetical protein, partial [Tahibacter aquaticus]|uniref:hypothetical protein n=1 Tax=Tahibacter aquaticus TaxID=520092 RepID=UPI001AAC9BDD
MALLFALALGAGTKAGTKSSGSESVEPDDYIFASSFETPPPSPFDLASATPSNGSVLAADAVPTISIRFSADGLPSPQVRMLVDGVDVTAAAEIVGRTLRFVPPQALSEANHEIAVTVGSAKASWSFTTRSAPTFGFADFDDVVLPSARLAGISLNYGDVGSGIEPSAVRLRLDGADVTGAAVIAATGLTYVPSQPWTDGRHSVDVTIADRAGNLTQGQWQFGVGNPPQVSAMTPIDTTLPFGSPTLIEAHFADSALDIDSASLTLTLDTADVTSSAVVDRPNSREGTVRLRPDDPLESGEHVVHLAVANSAGAKTLAVWRFIVANRRVLEILEPPAGSTLTQPDVVISARVYSSDLASSGITINGAPAAVVAEADGETTYSASVTLAPGENTIGVAAAFADGGDLERTVALNYDAPPTVTITSPSDWQTLGALAGGSGPVPGGSRDLAGSVERPVAITGQVSKPVVSVSINQQQAQLDADRRRFTFERYLLHEGTNLISATATDASGRSGMAQITVYLDQTAPLLSVEGPVADGVTSAASVDVRGVVNDAVEGGVNAPEPQVVVRNAVNQQSVTALVTDRYYLGRELPLEIGANTITVTATDAQGNARSRELRVTRIAVGSSRVTLLGGDRQTGAVLAPLPQPLVVAAIDAQGLPLAGHSIHFDVLRGAGSISRSSGQQDRPDGVNAARNLEVETGEDGRAEVWLTLGSEASQSGNMIRAWSTELAEDVMFTATGLRQVPALVMVSGAAGSQYVQTQSQPVEPLTAVVLDAQRNAMTDTPVIFTIEDGDALFTAASAINGVVSADGKVITVPADKNGLASVRPTTGNTPGNVRVRAHVQLDPDTPISNAVFNLLVLERTNGPTGFSGVVLDHSGKPLQGVRLTISRTPLSTLSGSDGRFVFDDQVPPGKIDLDVDGRPLIVR